MPLSRSRDYLSIGEVLESVRAEFPDVSISKIRFLESEGLINPERTKSGYRKFYDPDIARLRYILSLQRDQFLPLKVIRERLAGADLNGGEPGPSGRPGKPEPSAAVSAGAGELSLSRPELLEAAGLSESQAEGLADFGILRRTATFDANDLAAASAARALFDFGVEPRHLRMYLHAAEREAALLEQIVSPVAKKRDPQAHQEASASTLRLLTLSRQLREALLRSSLRELL